MEYKGLVISDDIFMAALEKNGFPPETACVMAIEAGVNVIMLSEKRFANVAAILLRKSFENQQFANKIREAQLKVLRYKKRAGIINIQSATDSYQNAIGKGSIGKNRFAFKTEPFEAFPEHHRVMVENATFDTGNRRCGNFIDM